MTSDETRPPEPDETPDEAAAPAPEEPAAEEAPPPPPRCAVCDSLLVPDQTYCLECGTPTPAAPSLKRRGRIGWLVGLGLVIAGLGAGALAYAISGDDTTTATVAAAGSTVSDGAITSLPPDTTSVATEFPTVSDTTSLPVDTTLTDTVDTTATTDTGVDTSTLTSDWPSGRTAYTAILSSVRDLGEAQGTADQVRSGGQPAGILFSSDHAGLSPGFYVVFSGVYETQALAAAQAQKLAADYPGAYVRRVVG